MSSNTSEKTIVGRTLIVVAFILTTLTLVPVALSLLLGVLTSGTTGYAFVPFLLLMLFGQSYVVGSLVVSAVLAIVGLVLGGYRRLGTVTALLSAAAAAGILVWVFGANGGWF